jgi:ribosomal protein L28
MTRIMKIVKRCQNCDKGLMRGNNVTRARQGLTYRSSKTYKPNLHSARILQDDGTKKRMTLCTKCLRKLKKEAALKSVK